MAPKEAGMPMATQMESLRLRNKPKCNKNQQQTNTTIFIKQVQPGSQHFQKIVSYDTI